MASSRRRLAVFGFAAAVALGGGARLLLAQEESTEIKPEDLFASAKAAFDEKKYGRALADLHLLVGAVQKLRIEQIKAVLPAAPAGWKAEDPTGESAGGMFVMVGLTVKREYRKPAPGGEGGDESGDGGPRVSLEVVSDSPMVGMIAPMLSNPAMLQGQEGMSVLNLKGRKALLEWHKESKSGSLKVLLAGNTTLLTLEGREIQKADLSDVFAKALDVEKIEKVLAD